MKLDKKILYSTIIFIFIILISVISNAGSLYLNNLNFDVFINSDGSMDIEETWNIDISSTNTLYKTFETDFKKYSGIDNVKVVEVIKDENIYFSKVNEWAYHVNKNCYYGTKNDDGDFEIGWGVGLDNSRATKTYKISYTVRDAITKYQDYAELYWQFVGKDFEISSSKINGKITLPEYAQSKDNIKVWGHSEGLNGEIYVASNNTIEFNMTNFKNGRYVEIRTLFPSSMISNSRKVVEKEILQTAIKEETKWANEANAKRERQEWLDENLWKILLVIYLTLNIILSIFFITKIPKYKKKLKEMQKYRPTNTFKYFRDLPDENATPGEALITTKVDMETYLPTIFGKIFSAVMLDLALKNYIELNVDKGNFGKEIVKFKILDKDIKNLKKDELEILEFLKRAVGNKEKISTKDLEKYIKKNPNTIQKLISNNFKASQTQLKDRNIIDEEELEEYKKYSQKKLLYLAVTIVLIPAFCIVPAIITIINQILCSKICKKLNVLTQEGIDLKEQWEGLKKFMENFSMLDKREIPELILWDKYLVFATAFGIADKVIKQLKIVYPNFEDLTTNVATYSYINLMMNTNFSTTISNSMSSAISGAYSSGSGSGGGFSGGGGFGGGRWSAAVGR